MKAGDYIVMGLGVAAAGAGWWWYKNRATGKTTTWMKGGGVLPYTQPVVTTSTATREQWLADKGFTAEPTPVIEKKYTPTGGSRTFIDATASLKGLRENILL
jgi:hypothetical protein